MKPTFKLRCDANATDYWIYIHAPDSTDSRKGSPTWPAMLFMDGDDQFAPAVDVYRELRAKQSVPAMLLVGVGYGASYTKPGNRRGRDYTPVAHAFEPSSGGADIFLEFLTDTLWPELTRKYPISAEQRGIAGHSLGSLLVLHALFQPRPFFTNHLASAPAIWWADRGILEQLKSLRTRQRALPGRLFLTIGQGDTPSMLEDLSLLEQQLQAQPFEQLTLKSERIAERDHFNVLPDAFRAGFTDLYGPKEPV